MTGNNSGNLAKQKLIWEKFTKIYISGFQKAHQTVIKFRFIKLFMQFILTAQQKFFLRILFGVLAVSFTFACSKAQSESDNRRNAPEGGSDVTISITIDRAVSRDVPAYIQSTGTLVAEETSNVAPKAAGKVVNVYANVGQFISQGSIIARLDDNDARLRVAEAEANVKQAQAAVRQAEARLGLEANGRFNATTIPEVRAANANYEQAQAELRQAEANEKRYRDLVETGDVPMMTYEQYRTQRDTARARVNAAKQALEASINTARQSNQAIASAQAAVEASIENSSNALRTGMFVTARIVRQGGNVGVFVPRSAVLTDPTTQSYKVFVIEEGIAKLRVAQKGTEEGEFIQILSGVNADELVATSNLEQLYEGAKVQAVQ